MRSLTNQLLYTGPGRERYNMLWKIAGSFCYALASMVLSVLVMRMAGEEEGGIFSFGYSTLGQQLFIVAKVDIDDLGSAFQAGNPVWFHKSLR